MSNNEMKTHNYKSVLTKVGLAVSLLIPSVSPLMANAESTGEEAAINKLKSDLTAGEGEFLLPIMHMNDTHANVDNYPYIATLVKQYRESNENSMLLHGGDVFSGTLYFNTWKGQADLALLNLMDMDAMVFGNHEFDLGDTEGGHKSLSEFVEKANFPVLGTNTDLSADPFMKKYEPKESLVENAEGGDVYSSIIIDKSGEKIGLFGLTTEDTENISSPVSITFSNYVSTAKEEVAKLETTGIDKIVAVTHIGVDSPTEIGNDVLLAKQVDGIDVIVGGHSHTELDEPELVEKDGKGSTVIVQAGQYAENLGTAEVLFNDKGEVIDHAGKLLAIEENYEKVVEADAESKIILRHYKDEVDKISNKETGATAVKELVNPRFGDGDEVTVRGNETALGNLVTDAMLAKSKEKEPDIVISMQNGGGIRTSIDKGPITNGEVIKVLPFGNNPVVVELSGSEIKDIMEHAVAHDVGIEENGGFLHISGMKYQYDSRKKVGDRVLEMFVVDEDGKETEIQPSEKYKVTTNGFTGQGGDGFTTFKKAFEDGRVRDLGEEDWQQLVDYMVEDQYLGGTVDSEIEGRIIDVRDQIEADKFDELVQTFTVTDEITEDYILQVKEIRKVYDGLSGSGKRLIDSTNVEKMKEYESEINGWVKVKAQWYYYNEEGIMQTGWKKLDDTWYFMNSNGVMQTGWEKVDGTWYLLDNSGAMQTGWEKVNGTWYLLDSSGAMQTGWEKVNGTWYYMNNSGAMQTGWEKVNGTWYLLDNSGAMQTGWIRRAGSWYYTDNSGAMQTGWIELDGDWYYLHTNGRMRTGWVKIDNKWYYFSGSGDMQ